MSELTQQAQQRIILAISDEIHAQSKQVQAAIDLLDEGATVPFIARYRKEVTGGLDDTQLRQLQERDKSILNLYQRIVLCSYLIKIRGM